VSNAFYPTTLHTPYNIKTIKRHTSAEVKSTTKLHTRDRFTVILLSLWNVEYFSFFSFALSRVFVYCWIVCHGHLYHTCTMWRMADFQTILNNKGVVRFHKRKDRQYNDQMKRNKKTNYCQQSTSEKIKAWVIQKPMGVNLCAPVGYWLSGPLSKYGWQK